MAAYYKVEVTLNSQAVQVGLPSPQSVRVTLPNRGPQGVQGLQGEVGPIGPVGETGSPGADGREVELQTTETHVQWRYEGESEWTDLVALTAITGPQGEQGETGLTGAAGADGREVELRKTETHVQWRYEDEAEYTDLIALTEITGPQGQTGDQGPAGPANTLAIGTVTTGAAGSSADATISGTPPNQTLDLVLPRGDTGAQGNPGPTGAGGVGVVPAPIYATMQEAVEDGITFGGVFRHTSGSVYWVEEPDPDAATFIAASGATDVWNIQQFVKGVKDLGLWDDMVCWPLRSTQNAGTGTTAYSLGGLGTFNGTLVNGPTWGSDGVVFANASSQYVSLGASQILAGNSDYTVMGVAKLTNVAVNLLTVIGLGNVKGAHLRAESNGSTQARFNGHDVSGTGWAPQTVNGPTTSMFAPIAAGDAASLKLFINSGSPFNTQNIDARINPASTLLPSIGAFNNTGSSFIGFWNGDIAAGAIWNVKLTDAQVASFYALYKATLGTGLGLP
jgi:hypothetical protein